MVSGVLLRKPARPLAPESTWWKTLRKTIRTYFLEPYSGPFFLRNGEELISLETDKHGSFEAFLPTTDTVLQFVAADRKTTISPLHPYPHRFDYQNARYLVVSDIDDTILISKSSIFFSKLWLMLFRQTARRNFVEETEQAYRQLMRNAVPFAYLSASEYNLFSTITNFITYHELPLGPVLLRPFQRWKRLLNPRDRKHYKLDRFEALIAHFPGTHIILFGDDSQHDPQVFADILTHHPGRIRAVFLRKTGFVPDDTGSNILAPHAETTPVFAFSKFSEIEQPLNALIDEITGRS